MADWLAYAVLLLHAIAFAFFLLMLLTKIVEGFIRLSGGVPFDESTHPLDGGLFAAIMDLDCLNPLTGGKAAARKRRKHGSRQLQRNVNAAGSLSTQMMLDRHSMGVSRPPPAKSPGSTPFLSPTAEYGANNYMRDGYFSTASPPPLGPPPLLNRLSSEYAFDEPSHGGNIMDAWRPHPIGYTAPGTYAPTLASPSHGGIDGNAHNYMAVSGGHSRKPSSDHTLLNTPASPRSPGMRANKAGNLPAPLAIPKRRSLNDLKDAGASPASEDSSPTRKKAKAKGWFARNQNDESPSESEEEIPTRRGGRTARGRSGTPKSAPRKASNLTQDPQRAGSPRPNWMVEPLPFQSVPTSPIDPPRPRNWFQVLGLTRNRRNGGDEESELARDENKARKAALAAQSGALFAGVEEKPKEQKSFKVHRKPGAGGSGAGTPVSAGPSAAAPQRGMRVSGERWTEWRWIVGRQRRSCGFGCWPGSEPRLAHGVRREKLQGQADGPAPPCDHTYGRTRLDADESYYGHKHTPARYGQCTCSARCCSCSTGVCARRSSR